MTPIDKICWIYVKNRKVLFVRSRNKDVPYTPGGKREGGETDVQALARELKEELQIDLVPESIKYLRTVVAQAHGKPEGMMVELKCYEADFKGVPTAGREIEEIQWVDSRDKERLSIPGQLIIDWLKKENKID